MDTSLSPYLVGTPVALEIRARMWEREDEMDFRDDYDRERGVRSANGVAECSAGHTRGADRGGTRVPMTAFAKTCVTGCASTGSSTPAISRSIPHNLPDDAPRARPLHHYLPR